jgi:hypothetical protein
MPFEKWEWVTVTLYQSGAGDHQHHCYKGESVDQWLPASVLLCCPIHPQALT